MTRNGPLALAYHALFIAFILAPILIVCWVAFTPLGYLSIPIHAFSLRWFRAIADYPEFIAAFEHMASLATKAGVEGRTHFQIHTPLIRLSKSEIIRLGAELGVDFGLTHSCYDPDAQGRSCGLCDSCRLRLKGFADAGLQDPLEYAPIEYTLENL